MSGGVREGFSVVVIFAVCSLHSFIIEFMKVRMEVKVLWGKGSFNKANPCSKIWGRQGGGTKELIMVAELGET